MDYLFEEGELDDAVCPRCGGEMVPTDIFRNDRGDRCQVAFCPDCPEPELGEKVLIAPKSARKVN